MRISYNNSVISVNCCVQVILNVLNTKSLVWLILTVQFDLPTYSRNTSDPKQILGLKTWIACRNFNMIISIENLDEWLITKLRVDLR